MLTPCGVHVAFRRWQLGYEVSRGFSFCFFRFRSSRLVTVEVLNSAFVFLGRGSSSRTAMMPV